MLPTVATDGARLVRVMLSLTLPSPLIFTVNGLPARANKAHVSNRSPRHGAYRKPKHQAERAEGTTRTRHVLVGEFGRDDVNPRHGGEVGDLAGTVFQVLRLDVYLAGAFHRQGDATIACNAQAEGSLDSNSVGRGRSGQKGHLSLETHSATSRKQREGNCDPCWGEPQAEEPVKGPEKSVVTSLLNTALTTEPFS